MEWIPPVTDRQESDIQNRTPKGFCNFSDLNRLENNCRLLSEYFSLGIQVKTDWKRTDFPTESSQQRIAGNVQRIYRAFPVPDNPAPPDSPLNTYQKWNAAETILLNIYQRYHQQQDAIPRTGEMAAGDQIGVI